MRAASTKQGPWLEEEAQPLSVSTQRSVWGRASQLQPAGPNTDLSYSCKYDLMNTQPRSFIYMLSMAALET